MDTLDKILACVIIYVVTGIFFTIYTHRVTEGRLKKRFWGSMINIILCYLIIYVSLFLLFNIYVCLLFFLLYLVLLKYKIDFLIKCSNIAMIVYCYFIITIFWLPIFIISIISLIIDEHKYKKKNKRELNMNKSFLER